MKIKIFLICMLTLVLVLTGCKGNVNSVIGDNTPEVTYENTICPNEDYAEKEEDKVYYTVKVYERGNTFTVEPSSNSAFFRAQSYDVAFEKDGGDCDISLEWETLSGSTESSQDDQLRIAHLVISQNGNILSDEKINFVGKLFGIVGNAIDKK